MSKPFDAQAYAVPQTYESTLAAAMSLWNVLNALARTHDPKYRYQRGHIRPIQAKEVLGLLARTEQRKYCEIGFNAGHSSALVLSSHPDILVDAYDFMSFGYSWPLARLLNESMGRRLVVYEGSSDVTLKAACAVPPAIPCDVVFVDGSHIRRQVRKDLQRMRCIGRPGALIMVDDVQTGAGDALNETEGILEDVQYFGPYPPRHANNPCMSTPQGDMCFSWGFATARLASGPLSVRRHESRRPGARVAT